MKVLVLGGYGVFGRRICAGLATIPGVHVQIAGRRLAQAILQAEALRLEHPAARVEAVDLDLTASDLAARLAVLKPAVLIHAAGPFQQQDYRVGRAAIAAGVSAVDLADGRAFVCGIGELDAAARAAGVFVLSGASSVPALSGAVLREMAVDFSQVLQIDIGICPGHLSERGLATARAALGYCGAGHPVWLEGRWQMRHGWSDLLAAEYPPPVRRRWLANCEVPDLDLWPQAYPGVQSVRFRAGLELRALQFGMYGLAQLRRWRLLPDLRWLARPGITLARWLDRYGSEDGAMHVELTGVDGLGRSLRRRWVLVARMGDGPQVPACASVALVRKLVEGGTISAGARPCVAELELADFSREFAPYAISQRFEREP